MAPVFLAQFPAAHAMRNSNICNGFCLRCEHIFDQTFKRCFVVYTLQIRAISNIHTRCMCCFTCILHKYCIRYRYHWRWSWPYGDTLQSSKLHDFGLNFRFNLSVDKWFNCDSFWSLAFRSLDISRHAQIHYDLTICCYCCKWHGTCYNLITSVVVLTPRPSQWKLLTSQLWVSSLHVIWIVAFVSCCTEPPQTTQHNAPRWKYFI